MIVPFVYGEHVQGVFVSPHTGSSKSLIAQVSIYSYTLLHSMHCSISIEFAATRTVVGPLTTPNITNIKIMVFRVSPRVSLVCVMLFVTVLLVDGLSRTLPIGSILLF